MAPSPLPLLTRALGKRRSWMLVAQASIALGVMAMAVTDPFDQARFEWANFTQPVILSAIEKMANKGDLAVVNILESKVNNVMLDDATGEGLCVIDLDTVMPGSVLCDFGDLVRTATCPAPEDETDLSRVRFDLELGPPLLRGRQRVAGGFLVVVSGEFGPYDWVGPKA